MQHSRLTGRLCFFRRPAPRGPILGSPRRAQRSGSSGGRRSKGAQRSFCRRQKRSRADFVTTKGRRFAPYKRFCRRRKPWRRANLLRPSILNNRVPIVCVGTQWEAGRRGRVPRYEGFLQPEVSIVSFCKAAQPGGFAFSCPFTPRQRRNRCQAAQCAAPTDIPWPSASYCRCAYHAPAGG